MENKIRISLAVSICMLLVLLGASVIPVIPQDGYSVVIKPDGTLETSTLNLKSKGVFSVTISGSEGYVNSINLDTINLTREDGVGGGVTWIRWSIEDEDLILKFDSQEVINTLNLTPDDSITLTLTWKLYDETECQDTDEIRCIHECSPPAGHHHSGG